MLGAPQILLQLFAQGCIAQPSLPFKSRENVADALSLLCIVK
eukprot:SAG31_NODE_2942_length_4878_cov_6.517263_2_plen_42_part_00